MNCFGIEIVRRPKNKTIGLRKAGIESDPQVYPRRPDSRRKAEHVSVSHPGFTHPGTSYESSYSSERQPQELRAFTLQELKSATKGFDLKNLIGEGGFGHVYKGTIKQKSKFHDGEEKLEVAIKQLNTAGLQGHNEWVTEVHFLGMVDNPYLVKLIGYCAEDDERGIQRLLVYEYMINKGLDDHIFRTIPPVLPWQIRVKIALGAARGLAYLHDEKEVIFRDFKTANVLLDEEFNPKLSDFGLARQGPDAGKTHVTTGVKGTYGYAAPEYIQTGHLTFKSDVFSFGVVLLEMLTGRRAMDRNRPRMEQRLLEWVKPFINDPRKFHLAMDPRLDSRYPTKAAMKFATIAIQCLVKQPKARLRMIDVVEGLKKVLEMTYLWETPTVISTPTTPRSSAQADNNNNASPRLPRHATEITTNNVEGAVPILKSPRHISFRPTPKPLPGSPFESSNPPAFPLPSLATRRASAPPDTTNSNSEEESNLSPRPSARGPRRQARDPSIAMENINQMPVYYPQTPERNGEISSARKNARSSVAQVRSNFTRHGNENRYLNPV
ncbi:hypothetical protein KC19_2G050400 [Ceratodon purpureus]|uniref:non-specific serine/threonine protein kinase n=1 Tax=Ceratodon purpureus TaxID=3225 RepID=A0A8T0IT32_CERPU|nr:hypothetical protein KC19_2G050400 [Ceratodon purpureus]